MLPLFVQDRYAELLSIHGRRDERYANMQRELQSNWIIWTFFTVWNIIPTIIPNIIPKIIPNRWAYAIIPLLVLIRLLCTLFQIKWIPTDQLVCCLFGQTNEDVPWGDSRLCTSLYWYSGHIYNHAIKHYLFVISIYLISGKVIFLIFIFRVAKCSATGKIYTTTNCCPVCLSLLFGMLRILTLFTTFFKPS